VGVRRRLVARQMKLYERLRWRLVDRRQADWVREFPQGERLPVCIYVAPEDADNERAAAQDRAGQP